MRIGLAAIAILVLHSNLGRAETAGKLAEDETAERAAEAYVYAYPLVLMDASRQVMTAVAKPTATAAPINQFNVSHGFPDATFTSVVSPNADTLYSFAWLDLAHEPIVLRLPDTGDRYYLIQMLDGWTNVFASPGTRTTGNHEGNYAIVGPRFTGKLPAELKVIKSPTSLVWIIGRTQTNGKGDYAAVRALKSQYKLIPLSAWGSGLHAPVARAGESECRRFHAPGRRGREDGSHRVFWAACDFAGGQPAGGRRPTGG